jgi:hypothetical protein
MDDMNTITKKLFNALAFANVSNLGEFQTLLRQIDEPDTAELEMAQPDATAPSSAIAPIIGHIQGAL